MSNLENDEVPSTSSSTSSSEPTPAGEVKPVSEETRPASEGGEVEDVSEDSEDESLDIEVEAEELDPLAKLAAKLEECEKEKSENYDRYVRAMADLENVRKRSRRELKDGRVDERGKVLKDMLPVIDNLERAVEHAIQNENDATKSIIEGVQMVLRQFHQALARNNVTALDAVGKPFDPAIHEAVSQAPSAEYPAGTVISVLQTGYMIEQRLLRPSLAVVSIPMPKVADTTEAKPDEADPEVEVKAEEEE